MKYNSVLSQDSDIGQLVRKAESDFTSGTTHKSAHVDVSLYDDINRIEAYLESKHISGATDDQGREKPFFNIVLAARNIWFRATDIDRSNIKIRATKSQDDIAAFLATVKLHDWMRRENFGVFLNSWGINMAGYNETVVKFVRQNGKLIPSVVPWNRIICDSIDFASNPKIEILELTEAQLRKNKNYDQDLVDKLCKALVARETLSKEKKDSKTNYIKLYEIHGELPLSYLTDREEDEYEYVQQMHVISFVASKEKGNYDDFTLFSGREEKDPYMLTALLPEIDGSIALRGAVKTLFDAQWMENHTAKAIKDQLDLASKLIFQTSDTSFVGQNALSNIETGDVLIHKVNEPLTMLNNKADISALQAYGQQWKQLGNEIVGVSEQMLGVEPKSGTAWRQTEALLNEAHSLFEIMTENKGLAIETMLREHIIPFIKTQLNSTDEVTATLAAHDVSKIDARYVKNSAIQKANKVVKEKILNGEDVTPEEQQAFTAAFAQQAQQGLNEQGNQRFFAPSELKDKTWKEIFSDLEWDVECDITNEALDKDAFTTINTMMKMLAENPNLLEDPRVAFLWNKALRLTGAVSTVELSAIPAPQAQPPVNKVNESMNYKDVPPDVQRQIEAQAGLKPSQLTPPPAQVEPGLEPKQPPK